MTFWYLLVGFVFTTGSSFVAQAALERPVLLTRPFRVMQSQVHAPTPALDNSIFFSDEKTPLNQQLFFTNTLGSVPSVGP